MRCRIEASKLKRFAKSVTAVQLVHDDIQAGSPIRFGGYKAKAGDWVVVDGERQYVVPLERFLAEYQEIDSEGLPIFEVSSDV